jgi:ribonuclease P/MRP protein subunit RPP1
MQLWDYCVRADSDLDKVGKMAGQLGWDGVCVFGEEVKTGKKGAEMVMGLLIEARNPEQMRKRVRSERKNFGVIAVVGVNDDMNRAACETAGVDLLLPQGDTKIDVVMAKIAREKNVRIGFEFGQLLHSTLEERSTLFSQMLKNAKSVKKFGAPFAIVSGALSEFGLRAPSELMAFGRVLGFEGPEIRDAMSGKAIDENKKRLSGRWLMPGVEVEK